MEQEIIYNKIFKFHHISLIKKLWKQCQKQRNKAFPPFILRLKLSISANNYAIHSKTLRFSKILNYKTFKPVTTSRQTNEQKTFYRNNFSGHNYNLFANSKTTKPPFINSQSQPKAQNYNHNVQQQASNTVFLTINHELQRIVANFIHFLAK